MTKAQIEVDIKRERKKLVVALAIIALAINGFLTYLMGSTYSAAAGDITRVMTVSSGAALSILVIKKQGTKGLFGRAYTGLSVGLVLWSIAESIWAYTEIGLGQRIPFPSLADGFWIAGYSGFGYYLFALFKFFGRGIRSWKIFVVIGSAAAFVVWASYSIIATSTISDYSDLLGVAISVVYPILDGVLFVPAVLSVLNAGKGQLTSIPWIFIAWILVGLADVMLGYALVSNYQGDSTYLTVTYNLGYLCFTAGLIWYLRFFISGDRVTIKK